MPPQGVASLPFAELARVSAELDGVARGTRQGRPGLAAGSPGDGAPVDTPGKGVTAILLLRVGGGQWVD